MCGIVGYIGKNQALPILLEGLKRLEYRGYDSAGITIIAAAGPVTTKAVGKIKELEIKLAGTELAGNLGIAHTRWATHGAPTETNAHPHCDCRGKIWVAHNGIIENYQELKKELAERGHKFISETDSEVIPHLLEEFYNGDLASTMQTALLMVRGTYGLVVIRAGENRLVAARNGSPLLVGLGQDETIVASDVSAILRYTRQVIYLEDGEIADINGGFKVVNLLAQEISKDVKTVDWDISQAEKGGYPHFMLKEIMEQSQTIADSIRGRLIIKDGKAKLGGLENVLDKLRKVERIIIVACGTARHAALVGEYMLEEYAGISTEVDYASEFRYRQPVLDNRTALVAISQSGETADTIAAVKEAKEKGVLTIGIVNTVGSTIARLTDAGVYNHIGPEISVASTKAFTSQLAVLVLLAVLLGRQRDMTLATGKNILNALSELPEKIKNILALSDSIQLLADKYKDSRHFAYLGRKYNQPIAYEGALKLKECSYIHAEAYPSGEMKHGAIALIDRNFPSLCLVPEDSVYEKNVSNLEEIRARGGRIIAIATAGDEMVNNIADDVIRIPKTLEMLTPMLATIPLQLFAYHMAVARGCDVDKPRNLAKSVTVE